MTRITKAQLDNIITVSDKQGPDTASQTYFSDAFDATMDNTGDTDYWVIYYWIIILVMNHD